MSKTAILSVRIVSDADNKGFKKSAREANLFGKETDKLSAKIGRFTKSMASIGAKSTAITGAVAALGGVVGNLGFGVVALGAVAGACTCSRGTRIRWNQGSRAKSRPRFQRAKGSRIWSFR